MAKPAIAPKSTAFKSILDRPMTAVERPKPLPVGSYLCIVKGEPKFDKSSKKGTDYVEFSLVPQSPLTGDDGENLDVDADDLKDALTKKDGTVMPLNSKSIRATFYLTEEALYRLKDFLAHCGFDTEDEDADMSRLVHETAGCQVIASLKHRTSEDGKATFAELAGTAKVD